MYLYEVKIKARREIVPNIGANVTKIFFTLVTKSRKLVAKLATRMPHLTFVELFVNVLNLQRQT